MVERPPRSRFGAGCDRYLYLFLAWLVVTGFSGTARAGFNWVSDWDVRTTTQQVYVPTAFIEPPNPAYPDFVTLSASAMYLAADPQQSYQVAAIAERQFHLSGFNEPVRVTIQTVLDGWISFNRWGLKGDMLSNNGVDSSLQTLQRYQLLPGTNHLRITQTRDIFVTNGYHSLTADLLPSIGPNYLNSSDAYGFVSSQLQIGVYAINGVLLVPEPSAYVATATGLCLLLCYRRRSRRHACST